MHANGIETEKESSDQRFARYLAELRQAFAEVTRKQVTGELSLTVNLNAGLPRNRTIRTAETRS